MKNISKLSTDTRPQEQPEGSYPFGKNGIQNFIQGSVFNEPGFIPSAAVLPYPPNGIIETDKFPVMFSTNNTNSAIGYFDTDNDVYIPVLDDISLPFQLPFDSSFYITGQSQRNYKGELIVAFTDKNEVPFYINMDNPNANTLNDIKLFPNALPPDIKTNVVSGGILLPGAYYVAIKYVKKDGMETSYLAVSAPKIVDGTFGTATDKAIEIQLTNIDPDYENVQIAIVSKINGILTGVQMVNPTPTPAGGNTTVLFTGAELTEAITLEEILIQRKVYTKVGTMGQLNDALYIADLESPPTIKMQKWANLIRLRWHSKLITVEPVYEPMKTGEEKSHLHGEVYSWYIHYKMTNGTTSPAFVLIGEPLTSADRLQSAEATLEGLTAKVYQVEDTIPSFDLPTKSGYFSKWENDTEFYPATDDFDSTSIGGPDLRGQKIRKHRFPSIQWCSKNLYASSSGGDYGKNKLDMLGISVENVIIPAQYVNEIIGWEIFYAKRNVANSTVIGQSLVTYVAGSNNDNQVDPTTGTNATTFYSTGGNWNTGNAGDSDSNHKNLYLKQNAFHFYSFDMLYNKPSVTPDYMSFQLRLKYGNINNPSTNTYAVIEDRGYNGGKDNGPIVFNLDYLNKLELITIPTVNIKAVTKTQYVPNNIITGKWRNVNVEGFFGGEFTKYAKSLPGNNRIDNLPLETLSIRDRGYTKNEEMPNFEYTHLANLQSVKKNLFVPFTGQTLVREGSSNSIINSTIFYAGDTYICDYTFHTYGNWSLQQGPEDVFRGVKVARRFICECAANLYGRYEDPTNNYSRYYPKSSMISGDEQNYLTNFSRNNDPNQFGYKKDSNAQDDLFASTIFNTYAEDLLVHPYRVHRLGKLSRQTKSRSWRTCLPLDYYEAQKNMGRIIHLEGMDDRLIIHHENAMFLTQDKTKLETDIIAITLGSGDIFQFSPQEGVSSKLGFAGTQHDLACVRTPIGYVFIDSKQGQIFLYKGTLELINKELNTFFKEFLRLKEKNPFVGNGYTIGYDPQYNRILLTVKNKFVTDAGSLPVYDPALIGTYTVGMLLLMDGRVVEFLGINPTAFDCEATLSPTANNLTLTIPENTPFGTVIGILTGTNIANYYVSGSSSPFSINPATGQISVAGTLDYFVEDQYIFNGNGYTLTGLFDGFVLTINITLVNRPPVGEDLMVTIPDTTADLVEIADIVGTDREGNPLTYSILSGNIGNVFSINSATGQVAVNDHTQLNGILIPQYTIIIEISDGTLTTTCTLIVNVTHINQQATIVNTTINITDAQPTGSIIGSIIPGVDPENDVLVYTLVSESVPGIFTINLITLEVTLINNSSLNPATVPQYVFQLSVTDNLPGHSIVLFNLYVNVEYDRSNLAFEPGSPSCIGGSLVCADGYTLSADSSVCVKVTTTDPTITDGGCLAASTDAVYGSYFARIYNPAWDDSTIQAFTPPMGQVFAQMTIPFWLAVPNDIGVWVDSDCDGDKDPLGEGVKTTIFYNYGNTGSARTIYAGVFGDNQFQLKMNGTLIADSNASLADVSMCFKVLHIFPVEIINGQNIFNVIGTGDGSVNDAIGLILFDDIPADIQAATSYADLNVLFTSADLRGTANDVATCPDGYVLDTVMGSPICKMIETDTPTTGTGIILHWDTVVIKDVKYSSTIDTVPNQNATIETFQDVTIPYYPDIEGAIECFEGGYAHFLNVQKQGSAQKNNCTEDIGTVVVFTVPAGLYINTTSQASVDALAQAEVDAGKQAYANLHGQCN